MARYGVIYGLVDPRTGAVRYIGKTVQSLTARLYTHFAEVRRNVKTHRCAWIKGLLASGFRPSTVVLESEVLEEILDERERYWIARGRAEGWRLTNATDGGDGGHQTEESQQKRSDSLKRYWADPEAHRKHSERLRSACKSPEMRAMKSAIARAAWADPEITARRKVSLKAALTSPEVKAKRRQAMLGRVVSAATREKHSASKKALWKTPEYRENMLNVLRKSAADPVHRANCSKARLGYKPTEASRLKMSESHKKLCENPLERERMRQLAKNHKASEADRARASERMKIRWADPAFKASQSENTKRSWEDPEVRARRAAGVSRAANMRKAAACRASVEAASGDHRLEFLEELVERDGGKK